MNAVAGSPPALLSSGAAVVPARQRGHQAGCGRQGVFCTEHQRDFVSSQKSESLRNGAVALEEHHRDIPS